MKYCIEQIEGDFAVCESENREIVNIPRSNLYEAARIGDWFCEIDGKYKLLPDQTESMKKKNTDLLKKIMERKNESKEF